jgi:hypothetical protein
MAAKSQMGQNAMSAGINAGLGSFTGGGGRG